MASVRAIYILSTDNKILFSRIFPTVENRLRKKLGDEYIAIPASDKIVRTAFYDKVIREELLQEELKSKTYKEDLEIDHQKMEELIKCVDINLNENNFENYSGCPIVTLKIGQNKSLWPCIYIKKFKLYGVIFPNIDNEKYKSIKQDISSRENLSDEDLILRIKKLYEDEDISIVGSFILIENLLNYVVSSKYYEENKLHTLISNMVPFGNIIETNINFMLESLNFLNQRLISTNMIFKENDSSTKKLGITSDGQEKIKIPGWVTKIQTNSGENLCITIKEELKFVKYDGQEKYFNVIQCDINCLAELSRNCEITVPIKENRKTNYLGNLRIHPCAKLEDQNMLNDSTRIIFIPPHDEFKMGVFEIENINQNLLPIIGNFSLKESAQNEVKIYLTVRIDQTAIGKFEYFYINIPLGHFGSITDTKIMVQVGEVSLANNKTTLHWDLQNKVCDNIIVLSGTVNYTKKIKNPKETSGQNIPNTAKFVSNAVNDCDLSDSVKILENLKYSKKSNIGLINSDSSDKTFNIEEMIKSKLHYSPNSDIMSTNCYCKIHFKLNNYSISNIVIDKKSLLFYPKLTPKIEFKKLFVSNEYIVWNNLSFNNYDINIPAKPDINLLKINIEESNSNY